MNGVACVLNEMISNVDPPPALSCYVDLFVLCSSMEHKV